MSKANPPAATGSGGSEDHPEAPDRIQLLFPSPIGELALELVGDTAVRSIIEPSADECAGFLRFEELEPSEFLDEIFGHLSEYFAGARRSLGLHFDLRGYELDGLARRILREAARIPYGRTRTYRQIAERAGQPDAYRVVLATLVANPLPIVIPCHRVVTHKSGIGSYVADVEKKRWLLAMEKEGLVHDAS